VVLRPIISVEEFTCYYYNWTDGFCSATSLWFNVIALNVSITLAVTALLIFKHSL